MIPSGLLNITKGSPILIELKNGEAYNGHLLNCDTWMNVHLTEVICTSPDGDRFWRMPEVFIRGSTIKYLRIPDEMMDKALIENANRANNSFSSYHHYRGGGGGSNFGRRGANMGASRGGGHRTRT